MPFTIYNYNPDESLPDARDDESVYYTAEELDGAKWIPSPRPKEYEDDYAHEEWFILNDGRVIALYSFDLNHPTGEDFEAFRTGGNDLVIEVSV